MRLATVVIIAVVVVLVVVVVVVAAVVVASVDLRISIEPKPLNSQTTQTKSRSG